MTTQFDDIMRIEDGGEDEATYYEAMQRQINAGDIWHLQGSMGRAAMDAIKSGKCLVGREARKDFYGNVVPGRDMLEQGTKGTRDFVAKHNGAAWADNMATIGDAMSKLTPITDPESDGPFCPYPMQVGEEGPIVQLYSIRRKD